MTALPISSTTARSARLLNVALALMLATAALVSPLAAGAEASHAPTGTITVDGTTCTLADAITAANTDTATGGCIAGSGADTLDLQAAVTLTSALPVISSQITIDGNGNTIARDGTASPFRILDVLNSGNLTISEVTITGGVAPGGFGNDSGGGIRNQGTLTVNNSTVTGNTARTGGGIDSRAPFPGSATLTVNNSTISGNTASDVDGGGISNGSRSTMAINNSTISSNNAGQWGGGIDNVGIATVTGSTIAGNTSGRFGGGIYNTSFPSTMVVRNSTISGNTSNLDGGGGIYNDTRIELDSTTVTGNSANGGGSGGALLNDSSGGSSTPTATIKNSILANSTSGGDCAGNGTVNAEFSLIEDGLTCVNGTNSNNLTGDPNLGLLQNYGGPTDTHALLPGSPAIDAGATTLTTDQRNYVRPAGAADDIGAFEKDATPLAVTLASFDAQAQAGHVLVTWETVSEAGNAGFDLYRTTSAQAPVASDLLASVPSQGPGSTQGFAYAYQDNAVTAGESYWYWLEDVSLSGVTTLHGPVSVVYVAPTAVTLSGLEAAGDGSTVWPWVVLVAAGLAGVAIVWWRRSAAV